MKSRVVVKLMGGMGNQLFQYAAARSLADRYSADLYLDLGAYRMDPLRDYELHSFKVRAHCIFGEASSAIGKLRDRVIRRKLKDIPTYREKAFTFDPLFQDIKPSVQLEGYWQTERYFSSNQSNIRNDLAITAKLSDATRSLAKEVSACQSVSLHIRRGDYASNPATSAFHGLLPLEYYMNAVEYMRKNLSQPRIFVFSDDPSWAKENLHFAGIPTTVVEGNGEDRAYEDLYLMSHCRNHIIANSSFSWWGAWLAASAGKIVIAPKTWFKAGENDDRDLVPSGWIRF